MTEVSGTRGDIRYEVITLLVDITSLERSSSEYVYFSGWDYKIYKKDRIVDFIYLIGIKMILITIFIGEKKHIFLIGPL